MDLLALEENWEEFARVDPMSAILTDPTKRGQKWDQVEFFATGEREIDAVIREAETLTVPLARRTALDFGCGLRRLTQAMSRHFQRCTGVDISTSMVEQARRYNSAGAHCEFIRNDRDDLSIFPDESFDFIYSNIVLQHMRLRFSLRYVESSCAFSRPVACWSSMSRSITDGSSIDSPRPFTEHTSERFDRFDVRPAVP